MFAEFSFDEFAGAGGTNGNDKRSAVRRGEFSVGDYGYAVNFCTDFFWRDFDDVPDAEPLRLKPAQPRFAGLSCSPKVDLVDASQRAVEKVSSAAMIECLR